MARPRRGKSRRNDDNWAVEYFLTGEMPTGDDVWSYFYLRDEGLRELWGRIRGDVMRAWTAPGCRPWGWWKFEAPRLPIGTFPGWYVDGQLPEPRRYISGPGVPRHERLSTTPSSEYGIWDWFGDPDHPPVFETQYQYLRRHGLLRPGERAGPELQPHPPSIEGAARWAQIQAMLAAR